MASAIRLLAKTSPFSAIFNSIVIVAVTARWFRSAWKSRLGRLRVNNNNNGNRWTKRLLYPLRLHWTNQDKYNTHKAWSFIEARTWWTVIYIYSTVHTCPSWITCAGVTTNAIVSAGTSISTGRLLFTVKNIYIWMRFICLVTKLYVTFSHRFHRELQCSQDYRCILQASCSNHLGLWRG